MKVTMAMICAGIIGVSAVSSAGYAGHAYVKDIQQAGTYLNNTIVNGLRIGGLTAGQAEEALLEGIEARRIVVKEGDKTVLRGYLSDYGYTFDHQTLAGELTELQDDQSQNIVTVLEASLGGKSNIEVAHHLDEAAFDQMVRLDNLAVPRTGGRDGCILYNEKTGQCEVSGPVEGNELDEAGLQEFVRSSIDEALKSDALTEDLVLEIPENLYAETNHHTMPDGLDEQCSLYNQYAGTVVNYVFGSQSERLDFNTFKDWLVIDDGKISVDEEKAESYVEDLSDRYSTRYREREFTTTYGDVITFSEGKCAYGYDIDEEEELAQLLEDLDGNEYVEREPVYDSFDRFGNPYYLARDGKDDLCGTYVEVALSQQHLWFYQDGELVIESDLVSGDISDGHATSSGVYPIAYKERDTILRGGDEEEGTDYESFVKYWMPFNGGQGLHDASWRWSFGGEIYTYSGSHGCVNLPTETARVIYENIEEGTAVILYY